MIDEQEAIRAGYKPGSVDLLRGLGVTLATDTRSGEQVDDYSRAPSNSRSESASGHVYAEGERTEAKPFGRRNLTQECLDYQARHGKPRR